MNQVSAERPLSYRVAVGASVVLGASWLLYWAYLSTTAITKQSVYMGAVTFYAGVVMAVSVAAVIVFVISLGRLVHKRQEWAMAASLWGLGALLVSRGVRRQPAPCQ